MSGSKDQHVPIKRLSTAIDREEYSALYWANHVNRHGLGLYESSIRRLATEPTCEDLVMRGLLRRIDLGDANDRGYWITETGRQALERARPTTSRAFRRGDVVGRG